MTQDLTLTVYGLATDGREGTFARVFRTQEQMEAHVWSDICPNGLDPEQWKAMNGGDFSAAQEQWTPEHFTWSTDSITIDLSTVPAVAALVERVKVLDTLKSDLWDFIENVTDDDPERSDKFFALRERVRSASTVEGGAA